ncbi:MAG TPA: PAS domain S-box protein, partial [Chitinophagaceae bacterium]|nr:PAS domain S-box protein [Chitinophagaceae bacterium]
MADLKKSPPLTQVVTDSDTEFRNILMQSPSIFLILKEFPDMIIAFANEPLYRSWGRTPDILGQPLLDVLPELKDQAFPALLKEVFASGKTCFGNEEKATISKDGQMQDIYYNYVYQPNFNSQGLVTGVTVMATDVTEQVVSRRDMEKKEKELTQLANTLPALLWVANSRGEILYHNNQIENFWLTDNNYDKWTWQDFCHPDDMQPSLNAWNKAISNPGSHEVEQRLRMKDGTYRWHLTKAAPYQDENGIITKWIGTTTDIHNHKLLEEKLKQNERRYRSLAKATTSIIWTTDPEGRFIAEQISWSDYTGQSWNEYKDWGWIDMLHPDDRERVKDTWM